MEKSEAVTVSVTVVSWLALVPAPVTVTEYVPGAVVAAAASVSVELPPAVIELGLKEAVAPEGRPLAERATLCGEPLVTEVEIVDVVLPPCAAETLLGFALIEKSEAVTASMTVVLCVALVPVPVTVTEYVPGAVVAPAGRVPGGRPPPGGGFGAEGALGPRRRPPAPRV